jgi:hypothetical protein
MSTSSLPAQEPDNQGNQNLHLTDSLLVFGFGSERLTAKSYGSTPFFAAARSFQPMSAAACTGCTEALTPSFRGENCSFYLFEGMGSFSLSHARLLGFDLCPRLKELKQRHLFVPRGTKVPAEIAAVCEANVDVALIEKHWDSLVHLAASVMSGHASAVAALARFGSAAQGDPIYEAGVQLGRLLRTAFLADYFVKDAFRNELRRVLNRGEAVNALKRAIYTGRISPAQAKRVDEMQAVADALSLMANIVMAWNTSQMQAVLDRWSNRRQVIPPELIGKIAPTRLESINLRGVFRFPVDRYADQILPSRPNASITGTNG